MLDAVLDVNENDLLERVAQAYFDALLGRCSWIWPVRKKTAFAAQLQSAQKGFAAGVGMRTDVDEGPSPHGFGPCAGAAGPAGTGIWRGGVWPCCWGCPWRSWCNWPIWIPSASPPVRPSPPVPSNGLPWPESSPQLQALRARLRAAQAEVDKAQAGHKPTLDVVATVSRSDSDSVTSINTVYKQKYVGGAIECAFVLWW